MIIEHKCVTLQCDECGLGLVSEGITLHYPAENPREDASMMYEWQSLGDLDWHEDCVPPCQCGDLFVEHNLGTRPCEVEECDCQVFTPRVKVQ